MPFSAEETHQRIIHQSVVHPRIVIVDDDLGARQILAEHLHGDPYQIFYAADGRQLLAQLDAIQPDLILMAIETPSGFGYEACGHMRANPRWRHVPIILVMASSNRVEMNKGLQAGADELLRKPVDGAELRSLVCDMLRIKAQFDDLHVTLSRRADLWEMQNLPSDVGAESIAGEWFIVDQ